MAFGNGPLSSTAVSGKSSDAGSDQWACRLRVKGTFIDVSSDEDGSLSPRAASDPGSTAYASTSHFDLDVDDGAEHYMSELAGTMSQMWGESVGGMSQSSVHDEDESMPSGSDVDSQSGILASNAPEAGTSVVDIMPLLPPEAVGRRGGLTGKELRSRINDAAREVENRIDQRRKRAVLTAIQEIPEQVGDALQKTAMGIVDDVIEEVAAVKDMIEGGGSEGERPGVDSAVAKLEVIPDMIQGSLEAYFSRAERTVRAHMDGMIQNLEADLTSANVVEKMWAIPSEVQAIAKKAMQAAVMESRANAQQQIDNAIASLPNQGAQQLAGVAESRIMPQVPTDSSMMAEGAKSAVVDAVEQAVAVVKTEDHNMMGVANQVVAETLLRAKVESTSTAEGLEKVPLLVADTNEGSIGHPELCQRPCLYFARGACANGVGCTYCHLDHSRRPAHPDKKNRLLLKELSFAECVAVFKPVLKEKVEGLGSGDEALRNLESLMAELIAASSSEEESERSPKPAQGGRHKKQLQQFLRAMTLRSVLALLMRAAPMPQQLAAIEGFTASLRIAPGRKHR